MTPYTATADKVIEERQRTRLVRAVADGDLITATEGGNVLGVFQVNWVSRRDKLVAMIRRAGSEVATLVNDEGSEVMEGLRIALPRPKDGQPKACRKLLFMIDPAIQVQHARGTAPYA